MKRRELMYAIAFLAAMPAQALRSRFDFARGDPLSFLQWLQMRVPSGQFTVDAPVSGWVKREHLAALIARLPSKQPCSAVALLASSRLRNGSTVGDEAAFLIQGFRAGRYPPALNSVALDARQRAEIVAWWRTFQAA